MHQIAFSMVLVVAYLQQKEKQQQQQQLLEDNRGLNQAYSLLIFSLTIFQYIQNP